MDSLTMDIKQSISNIRPVCVSTDGLPYNGYQTLDPYVFQQMDSLVFIYLSDPFECNCNLQWTSLMKQYGRYIGSGVCSETEDHFSRLISNHLYYTNCSQSESFKCFSRSITCPDNQVCHNTETSYLCGCPRGYAYNSSGQCKDVDECDEMTDCEHTCQNTEGSFHCTCEEGHELDNDGYSCDDINECQELNGGCEFGCRNTIGSHQCYCYYGHRLINTTHCDNEIQYIVVQGIENEDYRFSCHADQNLTIQNFTCENIPPQTTAATTTTPSGCPIGYLQRNTGECVDEDECDFYTNCQHSCVNTEGSFHCECNEGYQLADDGYSCNDINECHELNGGCEFGCRNTNGSRQCYCYHGYELLNETHCDNEILCTVVQNFEKEDYQFTCHGDYNLTLTNFTFENVNQNCVASAVSSSVQFQASVIVMFTILILIIVVQTIIIILVLICTLTKRKTAKNTKTHRDIRQEHFQETFENPLADIIEKQPNIPPDMVIQIPDNTEAIPTYENMN